MVVILEDGTVFQTPTFEGEEMKFRTRFTPRNHPGVFCNPEDPQDNRTKQAMRDECDINTIVKKYRDRRIDLTQFAQAGEYADFSNIPTYHEAMNQIAAAESMFEALPSALRRKFENNSAKFVDFCADPKNAKEMVELGLAIPRQPSQDGSGSQNADSRRGEPQGSSQTPVEGRQAKPEGSSKKGPTSDST